MYCRSHACPLILIHLYCDIEVWTRMTIRFSERVAFVDDHTDKFLTRLAQLGGYCTADQAQAMGLAKSPSHTLGQLNGLEQAGFLRRVVEYPVVYQITKSVTRLVGTDMSARRTHAIQTVRCRLAAMSFYMDAAKWPADFIFGHEDKVEAFGRIGCPRRLLPQRGGQPYLWEEFVLHVRDGSLCVVMVDRPHWTAFLQLLGLVKRFATCRLRAGERLSLTVAIASEARERRYENAARHRRVVEHCNGEPQPVTLYQVSTPVPHIRALTHESDTHSDNLIRGGHERP
jgi:hypothetical protein